MEIHEISIFRSPSGWIDVQSVYCDKNRFKAKADKESDAYPYRIRCIRKDLSNLVDKSDCEDAECTEVFLILIKITCK